LQGLPALAKLAPEAGFTQAKLDYTFKSSLFSKRCYNPQLMKQISEALLVKDEPMLICQKPD
jgi:hypothetical protein